MGRRLRWGFSTGTAAAAAVKAALTAALGGGEPKRVEVTLPGQKRLSIPIHGVGRAGAGWEAWVVKDGGDDPDCTHGALVGAAVVPVHERRLSISAGPGVGTVTRPGLPVAVGQPAVNPVPRRMMGWAVDEVYQGLGRGPAGAQVEVMVQEGERLAQETLNPRLGIVGGLSILGTTGLVRPFSHGAYRATIHTALKVARAAGLSQVVLTTGTTSDAAARSLLPRLPQVAFVQMADYVSFALERSARLGFRRITVVCFFGKLVKMAQGMGHTHASAGELDLERLARWVEAATGHRGLAQAVAGANTGRGALELLLPRHMKAVEEVARRALSRLRGWAGASAQVGLILLDYRGNPLVRMEP